MQQRTSALKQQYESAREQVGRLERAQAAVSAARPVEGDRAIVEVFELEATRGVDAPPSPARVGIAASTSMVVFVLEVGATGGYTGYEAAVTDRSGHEVFRKTDLRAASQTSVAIALPRTTLPDGRYSIELAVVATGRPPFPLARYSVEVGPRNR